MVKLERARLLPFRLPLARPLGRRAPLLQRDGVLLSLEAQDGTPGFGEGTPTPGFGADGVEAVEQALRDTVPALLGADADDPRRALAILDDVGLGGAARAAAETALLDLATRRGGRSLASWLGTRLRALPRATVPVNALLAAEDPERLAHETRALVRGGFGTVKLKVGGRPLARESERVGATRRAAGGRVRIRLDANGAWSEDEAREALARLEPFAIEFLEQPVAADDLDALARLRGRTRVPIAADEAAASPERARRVIQSGAADLLVVKPSVVGGPATAAAIVRLAHDAGLGVVVTSALDGAVGVACALQLAATLPDAGRACGLATAGWLADDLAALPAPRGGTLALPRAPGLGVAPDPDALARLARGRPQDLGS